MRSSILLLGIASALTVGCGGSAASDGAGGHSPTNGGNRSNAGSHSAGGAGNSSGGAGTGGQGGALSAGTGGTEAPGGDAAQAGSASGASTAGGVGGASGGGSGGMSDGGKGGVSGSCSEPSACEGYDNQLGVVAAIACLSPSSTPVNAPFTLDIFGHHLATGATMNAVITVASGTPLNGVPMSACHLRVQVPADQIATAKQVKIVVAPGGFIQDSSPAWLTVQ